MMKTNTREMIDETTKDKLHKNQERNSAKYDKVIP